MTTVHTDETPVWFLDVDGVLNAVVRQLPDGYSKGYATPNSYESYTIQWDPTIVERIMAMHRSGDVKVVWLTTWGSGANGDLRDLLGMDELEVAGEPPMYASGGYSYRDAPPGGWWKLGVVQRAYASAPDRKYVWTDDDLAIEHHAQNFVKDKNFLSIAPRLRNGLTHQDLDIIEQFLRGRQSPKIYLRPKEFNA